MLLANSQAGCEWRRLSAPQKPSQHGQGQGHEAQESRRRHRFQARQAQGPHSAGSACRIGAAGCCARNLKKLLHMHACQHAANHQGIRHHDGIVQVGKTLPRAQNDTSVAFKAKAITLPGQSVAADRAGAAVSSHNLTLKVCSTWQRDPRCATCVLYANVADTALCFSIAQAPGMSARPYSQACCASCVLIMAHHSSSFIVCRSCWGKWGTTASACAHRRCPGLRTCCRTTQSRQEACKRSFQCPLKVD